MWYAYCICKQKVAKLAGNWRQLHPTNCLLVNITTRVRSPTPPIIIYSTMHMHA